MSDKNAVIELITKGKTAKAIEVLIDLFKDDNEINEKIILTSSRFHIVKSNYDLGKVSNEDYNIEITKINSFLLTLINTQENAILAKDELTSLILKKLILLSQMSYMVKGELHSITFKLGFKLANNNHKKVENCRIELKLPFNLLQRSNRNSGSKINDFRIDKTYAIISINSNEVIYPNSSITLFSDYYISLDQISSKGLNSKPLIVKIYSDNGTFEKSINLFDCFLHEGKKLDENTFKKKKTVPNIA